MDPQKRISNHFPTLRINSLIERSRTVKGVLFTSSYTLKINNYFFLYHVMRSIRIFLCIIVRLSAMFIFIIILRKRSRVMMQACAT